MAINYAWEKLYSAVRGAMMSTDPLPRRLEDGYVSFHTLAHGDHLPPDLKKRFDVLKKGLTFYSDPTGLRGSVGATADKMTDDEARKWLEEILSLYTEVVRRDALKP
jgi:hypothetical protein